MARKLRVKVLSFAYARNRQAADFSELLSDRGHIVALYELDEVPNTGTRQKSYDRIAIRSDLLRLDKSNRNIPFVLGAFRRALFLKHALRGKCDVVVAINYPILSVAATIARLNRGKLVYYPLELVEDAGMQKREGWMCDRFCDMIIGVEPNRLTILTEKLNQHISSFVVPNAPRTGIPTEPGGRLIDYLRRERGFSLTDRIVLYHGVHHKFACLENIVSHTRDWPTHVRLVLMITGKIAEPFKRLIHEFRDKVALVPPVKHEELFEWVRDASIGLLPYEDDVSLNVKYCSPQKMFDFLACAVPFIGSKRPLIQEIAEKSRGGVCIDMTSDADIACAITSMLSRPAVLKELSQNARNAYEVLYNYDALMMPVIEYIEEYM